MKSIDCGKQISKFIRENMKYCKNNWITVNLNFYNPVDERMDQVQFDVEKINSDSGLMELKELFEIFCKENHIDLEDIPNDSFSIDFVRGAYTHDELLELEERDL